MRNTRLPLVVVAALLFSLAAAVGIAGAAALELEVCQGEETQECETQEVQQSPKPSGSGGGGGGGGGTGGGGAESHDFSVDKQGNVTKESSSTGQGQEIEVDLSKPDKPQASVETVEPGPDGGRKRPPKLGAPDTGGTSRGSVTTSGGGAPLGTSSPFDYVSSDEALSSFAIPPFLLPIYVSAGRAYDIPWNVLASINRIETDFGRLGACAVSYAGARGWMQFMPGTWDAYGVDASGDGIADPCNPVDAIYAAARYLNASGGSSDLRTAIFAYNHADWYVDEVLQTASVYGSLPSGLVAETGSLAFGHFPVKGKVTYADDFRQAEQDGEKPTGVNIYPRGDASAIATQELTVRRVLLDRASAKALRRQELAGAPKPEGGSAMLDVAAASARVLVPLFGPLAPQAGDALGTPLGSAIVVGSQLAVDPAITSGSGKRAADRNGATRTARTPRAESESRNEQASDKTRRAGKSAAGTRRAANQPDWLPDGYEIVRGNGVGVELSDAARNRYRYEGLAKLRGGIRPGRKLDGGEKIGPLRSDNKRPMLFSTQGAGGALVDPRPLLDGYRLQELADYYNAVEPLGGNPFLPDQEQVAAGGSVSGTQSQLARRVLDDPGIEIYPCGRQDVARGIVDSRVLGALLYLRKAGMTLTVTSLRCGHGFYTAGGSISAHSFGAAVDIAAFNGQSVLGNQGPGSLTAQAVKLLMALEGEAQPSQLISLMDFGGPSFALSDHADHLHVGYNFEPSLGLGRSGAAAGPVLFGGGGGAAGLGQGDPAKPSKDQERRLSERLGKIENPSVRSDVGPNGVHIEGERRDEKRPADRLAEEKQPLEATPEAAGARIRDVAVTGAEAHAIGVVDGTAAGWESRQTVILAQRDGVWEMIGPPRDGNGRIADPELSAISATAAGRGYAVGEKGAVVAISEDARPQLLRTPGKSDLSDVAMPADGKGDAVAVGKGVALSLSGKKVRREKLPDSAGDITAVAASDDGFHAVGKQGGSGPALLERDQDGSWSQGKLGFRPAAGTTVRLQSLAVDSDELWLGGAVSEADSSGSGAELPLAAVRAGGGWTTYCSGTPALANIRELGAPSQPDACDEDLPIEIGETGAIAAVSITDEGPVFASQAGLRILAEDSFRPVPGSPAQPVALSLTPGGRGYALSSDGRMAHIAPSDGEPAPSGSADLAIEADGPPAPVAVSPGGDRALAFAGGEAAELVGDSWQEAPATGLAIRDASFAGDAVWAIDESGSLLSWDGEAERWEIPGLDAIDAQARAALSRAVGSGPLSPDARGAESGFQALAFGSDLEGFAVGGSGLVARFLKGGWKLESAPTEETLRDVASGSGGVVAVGDGGTLLERDGDDWSRSLEAGALVDGEDFTAVDALADGSAVAIAGGSVIERSDEEAAWTPSTVPPLGIDIRRLAGYRDADGGLHLVALADDVLLEGTADGWRTLEVPQGMTPSAFAPEPGSERVWVTGTAAGKAVAATIDLASDRKSSADETEEGSPDRNRGFAADGAAKPLGDAHLTAQARLTGKNLQRAAGTDGKQRGAGSAATKGG